MLLRIFIVTMLLQSVSTAQVQQSLKPFELQADFARFRGSVNELQFVEIYYSIPQNVLTYQPENGTKKAEAVMTLVVMKDDSMVVGQRWRIPHSLSDSASLVDRINLVGVAGIELAPGSYRAVVIGQDIHDMTRIDSAQMQISITPVATEKLMVSDLELASVIRPGQKGGAFYKNTLDVVPNVNGVFDESQMCFFYAESYNLQSGADQSDYTQRLVVLDGVGREVISRDRTRKRSAESAVIVESIHASKLPMGTYTAEIALVDSNMNIISNSGKKFFVYNPTLGIDSSLVAAKPVPVLGAYRDMNEEMLDLEFDQARYESISSEKDQFGKLKGKEAKARFLAEFWARKPLGLREEYLRRVSYANEHYRSLGRKGYTTDRGRIHVTYGQPDDIERHPNESDSRPYEIWTFNSIQGGVIFVFLQRTQGSDYQLIHSTHRNEFQDESWQRQVIGR